MRVDVREKDPRAHGIRAPKIARVSKRDSSPVPMAVLGVIQASEVHVSLVIPSVFLDDE